MKDNFSTQASGYARFRPQYPDEMIRFIVDQAPSLNSAWDVGAGGGQAS